MLKAVAVLKEPTDPWAVKAGVKTFDTVQVTGATGATWKAIDRAVADAIAEGLEDCSMGNVSGSAGRYSLVPGQDSFLVPVEFDIL